jgi:pimeloyl-ACP methyl ester carboxylesterase
VVDWRSACEGRVTDIRYARSGDHHIAYSVTGEGPLDLIVVPAWASNIELYPEDPRAARLNERLASFSRLITFDKRGTGLSDRLGGSPTLEERMDDVGAVMDAVASERAALLGYWEGGPMSALFAATHPERVAALVLYGMMASYSWSPDHPWAPTAEANEAAIGTVEATWGRGVAVDRLAPSLSGDDAFRRWWARLERNSLSPGNAARMFRLNTAIDVRAILGSIQAPTLVLHRRDDAMVPIDAGRYVARQIPGARFVELPGADHLAFVGNSDAFVSEVQAFLAGTPPPPDPERMLTTVLFTDIVRSTERASALGDHEWRELLDAYRVLIRRELERFRGREVDTAGDGFLASFDGPARAVHCALASRDAVRRLGLEIRCGLHTGEVELAGNRVAGIAVHIGARIINLAGPGEVVVSSTVKDLVVGSGIRFASRGTHQLKGIPEEWHVFAVLGSG